jgi:hypothetical protein
LPDAVLAVRVDAEIAQTSADLEVVLTADSLDEASAPMAATS